MYKSHDGNVAKKNKLGGNKCAYPEPCSGNTNIRKKNIFEKVGTLCSEHRMFNNIFEIRISDVTQLIDCAHVTQKINFIWCLEKRCRIHSQRKQNDKMSFSTAFVQLNLSFESIDSVDFFVYKHQLFIHNFYFRDRVRPVPMIVLTCTDLVRWHTVGGHRMSLDKNGTVPLWNWLNEFLLIKFATNDWAKVCSILIRMFGVINAHML